VTSISSGILDGDAKGLSGRGTKFWLEIELNGTLNRYEYHLLDVLEKIFDPNPLIDEALAEIKAERDRADAAEKAQKKIELEARKESVVADPELLKILDEAIAQNPKAIAEFKAGKEKALNSVVGAVIKKVREQNMNVVDGAFGITTLLKERLE
jgi:aspartyl-tRNA(Asn)/glutamyl-tRNA(Gln) amidotransferase subunit B